MKIDKEDLLAYIDARQRIISFNITFEHREDMEKGWKGAGAIIELRRLRQMIDSLKTPTLLPLAEGEWTDVFGVKHDD